MLVSLLRYYHGSLEGIKGAISFLKRPRVHQLKAELSDCKQKKDQSVVQYYTNLKTIWDELASYSKVPPCTCGAANEMLKEREEAKVHQFLMGLDTSLYGHIRSNLLMDDEVASLSRAYALVLREERHKAVTKGKEEVLDATAAMAARVTDATTARARARVNNNSFEKEEPEIFHCGYCGKPWHTEENCWDKPGNQGRGRGRGGRGRRGRGRGGRGNYQRANAAGVADEGSNGNLTMGELTQLRTLLAKKEGNSKQAGPIYEDEDWTG
ncbi:uncharacterized protein LOC141640276 [Silene latifolia]|uniref:uncharacterized protein LOC141640276 n=1 Tax=Silene latifolia TaxID=37657 RepID=UPI003D7815B0